MSEAVYLWLEDAASGPHESHAVSGPHELHALAEMVRSGGVSLSDLWSADGANDWRPLSEIVTVTEPEPLPVMEPSTAEVDYEEQEFHTGEESTTTTNWWANLIGAGVVAAVNIGYLTSNAFWAVKNYETYIWMSVEFVCATTCLAVAFTQVAQRKMLPIGFLIAGLSITIGGIVGFNSIDAEAQFNLGVMYADGYGVAKDEAEAVNWYRKAAVQGVAEAQFNLGAMYTYGLGVAKDEAEAVKWYRKAAEQGYANAQFNLGSAYYNGAGVQQEYKEAVAWFRKAAEQGDASAQFNLGVMYAKGQGVAEDEAEAVNWYRKAAVQGYATAQYNLGVMYFNGYGVPKDETAAYMWFLLAGGQGDETARENIPKIEKTLTSEQQAEGQRMAKDWKPTKAAGK
jgi:TPR repeat protein